MARLNKDGRKLKNTLEGVQTFLNVTNTEYEMYFLGVVKKPPHDPAMLNSAWQPELHFQCYDLSQTKIQLL